jgi:hypothetical protein
MKYYISISHWGMFEVTKKQWITMCLNNPNIIDSIYE